MASKLACFWSSIIFFSVHFGSSLQGNGFQQVEKEIEASVKNTSTTDRHIENALYSDSDGNHTENDSSKVYINSDSLIWDQPLSASILDASNDREQEFAILRAYPGEYFSAKATMTVHSAYSTGDDQQSIAAIWVMNLDDGPPKKSNIISAGWHIYPKIYDSRTRFFVSWWVDDGNSRRGCYNLRCKGFVVHENTTYYPGNVIEPLSIYDGQQRYLTLEITMNLQTGDWWLYHGRNGDQPVGYWPSTLFTSLDKSATNVDFGGAVAFDRGEIGPPMGGGVFASEGARKAASLRRLKINNTPLDVHDQILYTHQSTNWYQIDSGDQMMYFGGPRGYTSD